MFKLSCQRFGTERGILLILTTGVGEEAVFDSARADPVLFFALEQLIHMVNMPCSTNASDLSFFLALQRAALKTTFWATTDPEYIQ